MQELIGQMPQLAQEDTDQNQESQTETDSEVEEEGSLTGDQQQPSAEPNAGSSLAGTYSADAVLQYTVEDVEAESSLPVTLQLNQNGTGTANVYGFSGDAVYSGNKVSFSVGMQGITCAFEGLASRNGSSVSIDGIMQCSLMGVVAATYGWSAQK